MKSALLIKILFFIIFIVSLPAMSALAQCPTAKTVQFSGPNTICTIDPSSTISVHLLGLGQTGVSYQLVVSGVNIGAPITGGTGGAPQWNNIKAIGLYKVVGTYIASGCTTTMTGSFSVTDVTPIVYNVSASGSLCGPAGMPGTPANFAISLSNSQTQLTYKLNNSNMPIGGPILAGTGGPITFTNLGNPGTYTISAYPSGTSSNGGCTVTMSGSVTSDLPPRIWQVSGGGASCGTQGVSVILTTGSPQGTADPDRRTQYQLVLNGTTNIGAPVARPLASPYVVTWPNITTGGKYTVIGMDPLSGCSTTMTGNATVTNSIAPFNVTGSGTFCGSATVSLSGSTIGVNYQLFNGTSAGATLAGTGKTLPWQVTQSGNYTIMATSVSSGCSIGMTGSANITINNPNVGNYTVSSTGNQCGVTSGAVSLNGSDVTGVNYQLQIAGVNIGTAKAGTGSTITWSNLPSGNYIVAAINNSNGCSAPMPGSGLIAIGAFPKAFNISGGGTICSGDNGLPITLSGSEPGVSYQLMLPGNTPGLVLQGNQNTLTWQDQKLAGSYSIVATRVGFTCSQNMSGTASITVNPTPVNTFTVQGGGAFASSDPGLPVTLSGSETGVSYQLQSDEVNYAAAQAGTNSALTWSNVKTEGTYRVIGTNTSTNCQSIMTGTVDLLDKADFKLAVLNNLAFQYRYDERKRMTQKKVPGADWMYMVYDSRDRLVMTQDGQQRSKNQWAYTKYDGLNRPIITGMYTHTSTLKQQEMSDLLSTTVFSETYNGDAANHGYTNTVFNSASFDQNGFEVMTVTYYDTYSFIANLINDTQYQYQLGDFTDQYQDASGKSFQRVASQVTGTKIKILGSANYLWNTRYYDDKYRMIQTISTNQQSGTDRITNVYDFPGKVMKTLTTHKAGTTTSTISKNFTYDQMGRLLDITHSLNGQTSILLSRNTYNELGQLVDKKIHSTDNGSTFKQSTDYRYNIRGWLTSINNSQLTNDGVTNDDTNDLFGMNLLYEKQDAGLSNFGQYNGNITGMKWSAYLGQGTVKERGYSYGYDIMNRLTDATHRQNTTAWGAATAFHENNLKYDQNGNILTLTRKDALGATMDDLSYDYGTGISKSNQLQSVTDGADVNSGFIDGNRTGADYAYDASGALSLDNNKDIAAIEYDNYAHLTSKVTKKTTGDYIVYTHDAAGRKLTQTVYDKNNVKQKKSDYVGDFYYENGVLQFINHDEGRVVMTGAAPEYQYHLKDHLGNVRTTFTTKPDIDAQTATLEKANTATESVEFMRYDDVRAVNSTLFDHTYDLQPTTPNGAYSERLSGSVNERDGLARSLSVMPGDKIDMEVYAKYVDPSAINSTTAAGQALLSLLTSVTQAAIGVVADGANYATNGSITFPYAGLLVRDHDNIVAPKAYLNFLVFDRNYAVVDGGYVQLSGTAGKEDGTNVPHDYLSHSVTITQPGYVYIYLSNESPAPVEVYFDDFKVTNTKSGVIQTDDYYPFGLTFNQYQKENAMLNKFQYNGKELQNDLGLNWLDFGARMYMPEIGRWGAIDPHTEKYPSLTSYSYVANMPTMVTDKDGRDWQWNWTRDKDGQINGLNLTLNGKILDRTGSYSTKQLDALKSSYINGIQSMLKGAFGKDFNVSSTINLAVAKSESDVKKTDHLISIISNEDMARSTGANPNGVGEKGGLNIWMNQRSVDETLNTGSTREITHEVGHTGGLDHPGDNGQNPDFPNMSYSEFGPNAYNFMWGSQDQLNAYYGMNPNDHSQPAVIYGAHHTNVDTNQLWNGIFSSLINNKLNQQYGRPTLPHKENTH